MKRKIVGALAHLLPGKAGKYIRKFCEEIRPGDKIVLWLRVSHRQNKEHLDQQEAELRAAAEAAGAVVVRVWVYVGRAYDHDCRGQSWFREIILAADFALKNGAKLAATETDRFTRPPYYHSVNWPEAQAREIDLQDLKRHTEGVVLVTLADPDSPPSDAHAPKVKRGHKASGKKGGRPKRIEPGALLRRRQKLQPVAQRLRNKGWSLTEIAARPEFSSAHPRPVRRSTVQDWVT